VDAQEDPVESSSSAQNSSSPPTGTLSPSQGSDEALSSTIQPAAYESTDLISLDLESTPNSPGYQNEFESIVDNPLSR